MNESIKEMVSCFETLTDEEKKNVLDICQLIQTFGEPFNKELRTAIASDDEEKVGAVIAEWKKGF